jgi:hypothetical protein
MDFLHFNPYFQVLICNRCEYALVLGTISSRLASLRKNEVTKSERRNCIETWKNEPLQPAQTIQWLDLPVDILSIPNLVCAAASVLSCLAFVME